jgi:DNA-binding response OmpR family regulator
MSPADRIAELEEEVFQLKQRLGLDLDEVRAARLRARGLSPHQTALVQVLYRRMGRRVDSDVFDQAVAPLRAVDGRDRKTLSVVICQVRKKLGRESVENQFGNGYGLTESGRATVAEWLGDAA